MVVYLTSCTKRFEDMNKNPNSPEEVPSSALLGNVVVQYATASNNFLGGLYSQQYAQNTYVLEDLYSTTTNEQTGIWNNSYSVIIKNAQIIKNKSILNKDPNMEGVATILIAQAFHNLTDIFGDIPYFDAVKIDSGIVTPKYDQQKTIYLDLLDKLKQANSKIDGTATIEGDLIFSGDLMRWKRYANSLRLRIALRMSGAEPALAGAVIQEMLQNPVQYPLILDNADNAALKWLGTTPYLEPWYVFYRAGNDNYAASKVMVDQLISLQDPRLPVYVQPAKATNTYIGAVNGPLTADIPNRNNVSRIGSFFTADPAGQTKLLVASETWLSIAEAAEADLITGTSASVAYYNGIRASVVSAGIVWDETALKTFLENPGVVYVPGDKEGNLYKIRLQKWLSLYLQGYQAWAENRRTDVPLLSPAPGTRFPGLHNRPPFRIQYPNTEQDLNKTNYLAAKAAAGILADKDFFWGNQQWWDKRTGVY